ncbi:protein SUPPRESSOR OF GENE SILENCING 3 homolog [Dendrobium catenatum]|uniref:protein SUPPRESSOR OF GENE SILENCING 3 homolog n=1 Tax=Dendrobium catenatum TaxID=906689 RepID=UPI0009F40A8F|nr:protein SUPPRESSOR OF GENE SILENCING 3 homolog [Dendrobium catenatum]
MDWKSRLKFDVRSYQEMVVIPMKQISEYNKQLTYLKNNVVKEKEISKALPDIFVVVFQKLRETSEENQIMDCQERFFKDQIDIIHKHTEEKERRYEKLLQEEHAKEIY